MSMYYSVSPARPDAHIYEVLFRLEACLPAGEPMCLARWIPGSYMLRNFAKSVVRLQASVDGHEVALEKRDTSTWVLPAVAESLEVRLEVHAHEASVRAAWLDRQRGFFNGTSLFPYVPSKMNDEVRLTIQAPTHAAGEDWVVATTLDAVNIDSAGFGEYRAADWDELIDHPVEMGALDQVAFSACGVPHEMVLSGGALFDEARLAQDLTTICEWHIRFFGEPAPVSRYLFQTALVESGYGGLEHRASTALMAARDSLPSPGSGEELSDSYLNFLGLCSHEYFHTWNVKRLMPQRFKPYTLDRESPTRLLWFFEGVTSYYDDLALVRSGLIDQERYLGLLAKTITRVQRAAGRYVQSVTDSSLDAWTKFYLQDENAPNAIISYYAKGALIALCLDSWIREASNERESLDSLMQLLWKRWLDSGAGLVENEPEQWVAELVGEAVANRLIAILDDTGDLPLQEALHHLGVELNCRPRSGQSDNGTGPDTSSSAPAPWLGATAVKADGGLRLTQVMSEGPAERAGLAPGDVLIALGGYRVTESALDDLLARHRLQQSVEAHAFRSGRLLTVELPITVSPADTAYLTIGDAERVEKWLGLTEPVGVA